jgi:tubulin-specific chaperone B
MDELARLKAYVSAPSSGIQNQNDSTVLLHVTHSNLKSKFVEIRLDRHVRIPIFSAVRHPVPFARFLCLGVRSPRFSWPCQMLIDAVKFKLVGHCGTSASAMVLQLRDDKGAVLANLDDNSKMLGYYSPYDGYGSFCHTAGVGVSSH